MIRSRPKAGHVHVGGVEAIKLGAITSWLEDPYPALLSISWRKFFGYALICYLGVNLLFAFLFWLRPGAINPEPKEFSYYFFFSVETLTTVGYGAVSPFSYYGHVVATTELICGVFLTALLTGLVFARFSRPRSQIIFSGTAVVSSYAGKDALMIRLASRRTRAMADVTASLTLSAATRGSTDSSIRQFFDLKLVRRSSPVLGLVWTLVHIIDNESPFTAANLERLDDDFNLIASISGADETIAAQVSARKIYPKSAILFQKRFVDIVKKDKLGKLVVDLSQLDEMEDA